MVFFTTQCKFVTTMDSLRKEAVKKHVKNKHSWYYHFDEKPDSAQIDTLNVDETNKCKASDQKIIPLKSRATASLDPTNNIAKNFFSWLTGSGGGCKSDRQAQQIVSKCLKFLKFCCKDEEELTFDIVDLSYAHRISFSSLLIRCVMIGIWDTRDA